jgi:hypothetical protein
MEWVLLLPAPCHIPPTYLYSYPPAGLLQPSLCPRTLRINTLKEPQRNKLKTIFFPSLDSPHRGNSKVYAKREI